MLLNDKYLFVDDDTLRLIKSIRHERKKRKWSQSMLANRIGVDYKSVSRYENNKQFPSLTVFLNLAEAFNWDISNNINFLFTQYKQNLRYFRSFKEAHGFFDRELQSFIALCKTSINNFFTGKGSILAFALVKKIFDEELRLTTFRQYLLRKKG